MKREDAKKMLNIIKAYSKGETIQIERDKGIWEDAPQELDFCRSPDCYRIKPKEVWRPYRDCSEMIDDFIKKFYTDDCISFMPLIWLKCKDSPDRRFLVTGFDDECGESGVYTSVDWYSLDELFANFTYLDDTVCGAKE